VVVAGATADGAAFEVRVLYDASGQPLFAFQRLLPTPAPRISGRAQTAFSGR